VTPLNGRLLEGSAAKEVKNVKLEKT
jgi:hypothetical protein